jgi:hypothetical protein
VSKGRNPINLLVGGCQKKNSSVSQICDPFEEDMNNREVVLATLCTDCFSKDYDLQQQLHDLAMEI